MKLSVVTCVYNRAPQMKRGIMSIINQNPPLYEIIIVDDGSTDGTYGKVLELRIAAEAKGIKLKYIYLNHPEHRISSIPRNIGIKAAKGDLIIFTESEVLHVGDTIKQIVEKSKAHPNNTILASQIWTVQELIYKKLKDSYFENPIKVIQHPYAQLTESTNLHNTKAPNSDWAITGQKGCMAGCLFAAKKKWLMDLGGFDEDFTGHGGDDFNMYDRLALYGRGMKAFDDIIVVHMWHEKSYPYNIYEAAERNLALGTEKINKGEYRANIGREWGVREPTS